MGGKIERIELFHVEVPLPTPFYPVWIPGYPQHRQCSTLLAVTTRDGLVGYATGPAFARERESLGDFIGQFLLGLDAYDVDLVRERLRQASFLGWRNSWMDIAFWDLAAKARQVPLHRLLAERLSATGPAPTTLPAYASFLELRPARARAEALERAQRLGFRAAKIPVHAQDEAEDQAQLELARSAVGPGFELMAHAHQAWSVSLVKAVPRWDLPRAQRFVRLAESLGYRWVQEPLHDESWDELAELSAGSQIAIAGGDLSFNFVPLAALIRARCYSVLTPDASFAGLGTVLKTMAACHRHGLGFSPSAVSDGLDLLANLHALSAWAQLRGESESARLEYAWEPPAVIPEHRDALLTAPVEIRPDGRVEVPTGPGLGVELDPRALRRYATRFYHVTPVRFVVSSARRAGLKETADLARPERARIRR